MKELVYGKSVTWMLKSMFVRTGRWWSGWGGLKLFPSGAFGWSLSPCINCRSARSCNESSQYHFPCFIPSRLCFLLFPGFVFFLFFFLCFLLEWKINNLKALKVEVFNGDRADWFVWFFLATEIDVFDSFFVDRVTFNWIILSKNGRLKYEAGIVILNFRCFDRSHEYFES